MPLFETPDQVRRRIQQENRLMSPQSGWGALGNFIGQKVGTKSTGEPQIARAREIQRIKNEIFSNIGPGGIGTKLPEFANALAKGGFMDEAIKVSAYARELMPQTDFTEFTKEERGRASKSVKAIDDRAATIRGSYGKLEKLAERAKASPENSLARRASINSMIANVVRLNSPGIVSETELKTYTGGQGTTAAMLGFLEGKGVNIDAWKASIDPSGAADPDDLLGIGRSLILGEAPPLFDQYEDAKSRATRAKISERAYTTNFGEGANKNLEALRELATPAAVPEGVDPADWEYMTPEERALF